MTNPNHATQPGSTEDRGVVFDARARDWVFIFDFDGANNVRSLNRQAEELHHHHGSCTEVAPGFDSEVLSALREAAQRCDAAGHASVDLAMGVPLRALSVNLTPAIEPSHFLLTAVDRASVSQDRLSSETVAAIAHHLRNPMAGIRGAVEVIGSELPRDNAELAGVVRQITSRIDDLDRSLDAMLAYLHPASPQRRRIEVGALLERILVEGARPDILRTLEIQLTLEDVVLFADAKQLTRTVLDLLTNCAEVLPAGRGLVELKLTQDPGFATIAIIDAGGGIPAELLPRVCDPFFTTKPRALGLGLTNARKFAQLHGGALVVRASADRTEVRLRLPL